MSAAPRGLAGPAVVMFTGTAASRALGLVRNAVLALVLTVNVAGAADAFSVANKLPNVIYMLVAGGVLNAVLVPQIVRAMRQEDGGREYVDRLLTMAGAALAGLTVLLTAAATVLVSLYGQRLGEWFPLAVAFAFWCIPQLFFYGLYTLLGQVLNARSSFGPYMWAPVVNNVVAIAGLAVFIGVFGTAATNQGADPAAWTPGRIALLAGTATAGVVAQALVLLVPLYRSGFRWKPRWGLRGTGLGRASRVATWAFAGLAVGQVGYVVVSNVAAAAGTAGEGSALVAGNAAYDNAFLVFMLPQSLITVSLVTALFTRMSANAAAGDVEKVRGDLSFGLRTVGVFTVFATAALAVLALPVVRVVLPTVTLDEARSVAGVTLAMLLGLTALGAWTLVQRVYYAYEDTRSLFFVQIPMAAIVAVGTLAAALLLEPRWWVPGAGLAMSVSTATGAVVAYLRLRGRLGHVDAPRVVRTHVRLVAAAAVAAAAGWGLLRLVGTGPGDGAAPPEVVAGSLVRVVAAASVMLVVYVVLLRLLRVDELDRLARPAVGLLARVGGPLRTMTARRRAPRAEPAGGGGPAVGDASTGTLRLEDQVVLQGRYRLTEQVPTDLPGAAAWRGHDHVLDRPVSALVLRGHTMADALDAARRAALVHDPRINPVLAVGTHEGDGFVVTDVVDGHSLADLLEGGPLAPARARALVGEAASALEAARRRGVHHLALRPTSLHVRRDGSVCITGLGIDAAQLGVSADDFWAASREDTVALVTLLYTALTGSEPRPGAEPVPPGDLVAAVPNDLDTLCVVTLGPNDDGPHSPAELIRELAPWSARDLATPTPPRNGPGAPPVSGASGAAREGVARPEQAPGRGVGGPGTAEVPGATEGTGRTTEGPGRTTEGPGRTTEGPGRTAEGPTAAEARGTAEAPAQRAPRRPWTVTDTPDPDDDARPPFAEVVAPSTPGRSGDGRASHSAPAHATPAHATPAHATPAHTRQAGTAKPLAHVAQPLAHAVSGGAQALGVAAGSTRSAVGHAAGSTRAGLSAAAGTTGRALGSAAQAAGHVASSVGSVVGRTAERARTLPRPGAPSAGAGTKPRPQRERTTAMPEPDATRRRFDPTPYVLAIMLALVLFGTIWAVGVLTGGSAENVRPTPPVVQQDPTPTPTATDPAGEPPAEPAA